MQGSGRSTQKLWKVPPPCPVPPRHRPPERPLRQQREGKDKDKPSLKKARRSSVGAPLVSESETEESDTEESETEVGYC